MIAKYKTLDIFICFLVNLCNFKTIKITPPIPLCERLPLLQVICGLSRQVVSL